MAFFCFMGHPSHSTLTDWNPESFAFHKFIIFGTLRNPHLWFEYTEVLWKIASDSEAFSNNMFFGKCVFRIYVCGILLKTLNLGSWNLGILESWNLGIWNLGTLEPWNLGILEPWNFETLELWNFELNNSLNNRLLMVNGSWLMAQGRGGGGGLGRGGGPGALAGLPWAMGHEPLPINNRLSDELFDYIF